MYIDSHVRERAQNADRRRTMSHPIYPKRRRFQLDLKCIDYLRIRPSMSKSARRLNVRHSTWKDSRAKISPRCIVYIDTQYFNSHKDKKN